MLKLTKSTLQTKLLIAFVGVILFTAFSSVIASTLITKSRFLKYTLSADIELSQSISLLLEQHYRKSTSWIGIEEALLADVTAANNMQAHMKSSTTMADMMGSVVAPTIMWTSPTSRILVADLNGRIVADTTGVLTGQIIPQESLESGTPIVSLGKKVGIVMVGSMIDSSLSPMEQSYVRSMAIAILISTGIALALAFVFSSSFVSRLTHPIRQIVLASEEITSGNLSARVNINRSDEIGLLAQKFNSMGQSLESGEEQRKQLIADIAHELRSPLSLIRGNLEAIIDSVYPMTLESVKRVHADTLFLEKLVCDLRELSLYDAGAMTMNWELTDLDIVIDRAVHAFENESKKKEVTLEIASGHSGLHIYADSDRLHQVLNNLLSNALRYTPAGGSVKVGVIRENSDDSENCTIYVEDTGPGISADNREKIFQRFFRADTSRSRSSGGSGLGLSISRKIIEAHGGSIGIDETCEFGTKFLIMLPKGYDRHLLGIEDEE